MVKSGIIDFSAFLNKDLRIVIKELTVIDVNSKCMQHWIFKPPQDQQQSMLSSWTNHAFEYRNSWMSTHFHGLYYSNGFTPYECLTSLLTQITREIHVLYAPTSEKARVIEKILNQERAVISLEQLGCPLLPREPLFELKNCTNEEEHGETAAAAKSCLFHETYAPGFYCTQRTVQILADWCIRNPEKIDLNNVDVRAKTFLNWPLSTPNVNDMAKQGFIFMCSTKDHTKCIYCGLVLLKWEENDDPSFDHEHNSPFCQFIRYQAQLKQEEEQMKDSKKPGKAGNPSEEGKKPEGEDVCGCYEIPKITQADVYNQCYA